MENIDGCPEGLGGVASINDLTIFYCCLSASGGFPSVLVSSLA